MILQKRLKAKVKKFGLRTGDTVEGEIRAPKDNERYFALTKVNSINYDDPEKSKLRVNFDNLTPLYPTEKLNFDIICTKCNKSWALAQTQKEPNGKLKFLISDTDEVPANVITYIAENFDQNVRDLEGALRRFISYCVSFNIDFNYDNLVKIISEARTAGLISNKAGIINIHVGYGKGNMDKSSIIFCWPV